MSFPWDHHGRGDGVLRSAARGLALILLFGLGAIVNVRAQDYTTAVANKPAGFGGLLATFLNTGGVQSLVVPAGVTSLYVAVCGAKGGDANSYGHAYGKLSYSELRGK